jgi:hypothetical protein
LNRLTGRGSQICFGRTTLHVSARGR